jgi:hypothetical protein
MGCVKPGGHSGESKVTGHHRSVKMFDRPDFLPRWHFTLKYIF